MGHEIADARFGPTWVKHLFNKLRMECWSVGWVESSGCSIDILLEGMVLFRILLSSFQGLLGVNSFCSNSFFY